MIGVSIRFVSAQGICDYVWHVLDIYPGSPADLAGLEPHTDYIVGTPTELFTDSEALFNIVEVRRRR